MLLTLWQYSWPRKRSLLSFSFKHHRRTNHIYSLQGDFVGIFLSTGTFLFNIASSAATQIPLCRGMPGLLLALATRRSNYSTRSHPRRLDLITKLSSNSTLLWSAFKNNAWWMPMTKRDIDVISVLIFLHLDDLKYAFLRSKQQKIISSHQ